MSTTKQISGIKAEELRYEDGTTLVGQDNTPGLSAHDMQMSVESLGRNVLIPKVNEIVNGLNGTYSKEETDKAINNKVTEIGAGDMARSQYDPAGTVLAAGGIQAYADETAQTHASDAVAGSRKPMEAVSVALSASGWSDTAPYTQTVAVEGMTEDWVPGVPVLALGGAVEVDALLAATEALGCIKMITSAEGSLTFTAPEDKPAAALTLRVPGLVERS